MKTKEVIFKEMREEMPWAVIGEEKLKPYILEAMQIYAEEYHREQVKNFDNEALLARASDFERRELLILAFSWVSEIGEQFFDPNKTVQDMTDKFLAKNNGG